MFLNEKLWTQQIKKLREIRETVRPHLPSDVQKQLEEERKRQEGHLDDVEKFKQFRRMLTLTVLWGVDYLYHDVITLIIEYCDIYHSVKDRITLDDIDFSLHSRPMRLYNIVRLDLIHVDDYIEEVYEKINDITKVPLLLDASGKLDIFLSFQAVELVEAKTLYVSVFVKKQRSLQSVLHSLRHKVLNALKNRKIFVLLMENSAVDFLETFNDEVHFPVQKLFQPHKMCDSSSYSKMLEQEPEAYQREWVCRPPFRCLVTSKFAPDEFRQFLRNSLPLDKTQPVYVSQPNVVVA